MSYGGRIAILPGQSKAEEFSTLVHELAHEMLHKAERRTATTKVVHETEAEAIALVIGKTVGLETGTASAESLHVREKSCLCHVSFEVDRACACGGRCLLPRGDRCRSCAPCSLPPMLFSFCVLSDYSTGE
jgi:hypothetical protein